MFARIAEQLRVTYTILHDNLGVFARFADQLPFTIHHGVAADEIELARSIQTSVMIQFARSIQTSVRIPAVCERGEQRQLTLELVARQHYHT